MAISVVDSGSTAAAATNGGDVALTVSSLAENDLIIVMGGIGGSAAGTAGATGNNSGAFQSLFNNDAGANIFYVGWQRMGVTPDTSITCTGNGDAGDATAYACITLRGASLDSPPTDATTTTASSTSTNPNPPSIDWSTAGTAVIAGALSEVNDAAIVAPSGYSTATVWTDNGNDTEDATVGIAYLLAPADPEDPAAFTSWGSGLWQAATVAIKPAPVSANVPASYHHKHHNLAG